MKKERSCPREHDRGGGFMAPAAPVAAPISVNYAGLHNSEIAAKIIPGAKNDWRIPHISS
jgi:hypothetical protein